MVLQNLLVHLTILALPDFLAPPEQMQLLVKEQFMDLQCFPQ